MGETVLHVLTSNILVGTVINETSVIRVSLPQSVVDQDPLDRLTANLIIQGYLRARFNGAIETGTEARYCSLVIPLDLNYEAL